MSQLAQRLKTSSLRQGLRQFGTRAWECLQAVSTCRECGERINPLASVCHRCGAGSPFKLAISPHVVFTAVVCEIVLLWLRLRCG